MMRSKVDFPQPEGPTKVRNSPASTARSIPFRTGVDPKAFSIPVRTMLATGDLPHCLLSDAGRLTRTLDTDVTYY